MFWNVPMLWNVPAKQDVYNFDKTLEGTTVR